jgi:cell division protein FtsL
MAGEKKKNAQNSGNMMKRLISGTYISETLILNNIRYVILIAFLAIIYISNRFQAEKVERETGKLEQEVRDLRAESLSVSSELMTASRQSEVYRMVKERGLGLQELREPPYRIVVSE